MLVTVIVPVKDPHLGFLAEALGSVRDQTVPRWRMLIVIEPCDLRSALGHELEEWTLDPRTSLVVNQGVGLAGAINTAMREAESEFVALLLADDLWHPDAVATLEDYITRYSNADFFHSARRIIDDHGRPISSIHAARTGVALAHFREGGPIKHLLCWRRPLGVAVGGLDERTLIGPDDFDFPWTMAEHGAIFCPIDQCLYIYRDHRSAARLTTHVPRSVQIREMRRVMRKHGLSRREASERIRRARRSHLRQCLYRWKFEQRVWRYLGLEPPIWRETYR